MNSFLPSHSARGIVTNFSMPFIALCMLLSPFALLAQQYNLAYALPEGQTLTYKRVVEENAYAQLHSNLSAEVFKQKEAFFGITGVDTNDEEIVMTYRQDTVYVDETPPPPDAKQSVTINNILSQIPIRLTISPKGELISAVAEKGILALKGLTNENFSERQIAAMAMFLPKLPDEAVTIGKTWNISAKDTVIPYPTIGERNSLRIQTVDVTYRAEDMVTLAGRECLKISWDGSTLTEEKYIEGGLERYVEETVTTKGSYYFDIKAHALVELDQQADTEMTTAYYGEKSGIVPYSNKLHTKISLQE